MTHTNSAFQTEEPRSLPDALKRGARMVCPACGKGRMFRAFLKVSDRCPSCGEELHHQRADDAPPYFTMVIVGHVVVGGVLALEQAVAPPQWLHFILWVPLTILLSLILLQPIKGMLVAAQWALRMHGFGKMPDIADPTAEPAVIRNS